MQIDSTLNDLIAYSYCETNVVKTLLIESQLSHDFELQEEMKLINDSKEILDSVLLSPSSASVDLILAISDLNSVMETEV